MRGYSPRILTGKKGCVSGCKSQVDVSAMCTPLWAGERGLEEGQEGRRVPWAAAQLVGLPGTGGGLGRHGADRVAGSGLGSWQVQWESDRRPVMAEWSGPAGVWTQSWRGRSRKQARAGGSGDSPRVKSQEVSSDSKSGVWEGWGLRAGGWEARIP